MGTPRNREQSRLAEHHRRAVARAAEKDRKAFRDWAHENYGGKLSEEMRALMWHSFCVGLKRGRASARRGELVYRYGAT